MLRNYRVSARLLLPFLVVLLGACGPQPGEYDIILRGGTIYDGLGNDPVVADLAISGDKIAAIGDLSNFKGKLEYDVRGQAVAPGFINMLSWSTESLIEDGRGMSDILQGVTLEVMGEGFSMGPLNAAMKEEAQTRQGDIKYDITWSTLGEYLDYLVAKGISPNVASYVGATSVRVHEIGFEDREPSPEELGRMQELVRVAMREGAIGVGSSLIYAPASFANTEELIALVQAAADYGGAYISHIRSEGNRLEDGVQELIKISSATGAPAEIYHLKAAGRQNWDKFDGTLRQIEEAQDAGLAITADMYTYTAGATGLDAAMPQWVQEGGHDKWVQQLRDPQVRARVVKEMQQPTDEWENFFVGAGPENIILLEFRNAKLKPLTGKTLLEVSRERGTSPAETAIDLVIEDDSRVGTAYVLVSEENVRKAVSKSWVSFGSDAAAVANEGQFLLSNPHPRAYGNFARVLGKYSRDEGIVPLKDAIRRMTSLPAHNTGIRHRGQLAAGYFADVVVFDPARISDHSTFEDPHHYASGMEHVFVNGVQVLKSGEHTGALPGRVVRGPGWIGWPENSDKDGL